jgi:hypothetical protein
VKEDTKSAGPKSLFSLLTVAKHELNLLYTEPPAFRNSGADEGWFCREHAYHTYFLLRLLGHESDIELGDFAVRMPTGFGITSYGTDSDHAWCGVRDLAPIDLSMDFRYRAQLPNLESAIVDRDGVGPYKIFYFYGQPELESWFHRAPESPQIAYLVNDVPRLDAITLLNDPSSFFFPTDSSGWLRLYGADIFCRITMHIYEVVQARVSPLCANFDPQSAFRYVRTRYASSRADIERMLFC